MAIILNRNLPQPTDRLYEHLVHYDGNLSDIYVLEAGSERDKLSKYCTWYVEDSESIKNGLRYNRGMNYALLRLYENGDWTKYDYFFLLTNDTELALTSTIKKLLEVMEQHNKLGVLSPCSKRWGERFLLTEEETKYFWFIHNNALFLRRKFIEDIMILDDPTRMNFVFDGTNFRGCYSESELIAKAYANDWAAGITAKVFVEENESYLIEKSDLIKTETYEENQRMYIEEGKKWIRRKYGFNSRWSMQQYVKSFYDKFFDYHKELVNYKL